VSLAVGFIINGHKQTHHPLNGTLPFHLLFQPDSFALSSLQHTTNSTFSDSISTIITMSNSEHNIITGNAGYVLEDVPHLSNYIPHLTVTSSSPNASLLFAKKNFEEKERHYCVLLFCMSLYIFH